MADVARAASVSLQTVSNVINAPHLVRAETRERVESVIAATGYRPLKAAQTLRTQRSHLIAVIIPEPGQWKGELHNSFLHALTRRPPDIVAAAQARPLRDVRPLVGRRGHAPVGGRGRRARGAQGHRAPDRR